MSAPGSFNDIYTLKVVQGFWGCIDLNLDGHENCLTYRLFDNEEENPMMSIAFTVNTKDENHTVIFKAEDVSQTLCTTENELDRLACSVVLRLTNNAFQVVKEAMPIQFKKWEKMLKTGQYHQQCFSDCLIFSIHAESITNHDESGTVATFGWNEFVSESIPEIESHWSDYMKFTLKWDEEDCEDLMVKMSLEDYEDLFDTFSLDTVDSELSYNDKKPVKKFKYVASENDPPGPEEDQDAYSVVNKMSNGRSESTAFVESSEQEYDY